VLRIRAAGLPSDVAVMHLRMTYDGSLLQAERATCGDALPGVGPTVRLNGLGVVDLGCLSVPTGVIYPAGSVTLGTVEFRAIGAAGTSTQEITQFELLSGTDVGTTDKLTCLRGHDDTAPRCDRAAPPDPAGSITLQGQ